MGHLAVRNEAAAFALGTEAEILQHHDDRAGEAVIDAGHVHVGRAIAGHVVGEAARFDRAGDRERGHQKDMLVGIALAAAENVDRLVDVELFGALRRGQDERRAAVRNQRAVELVIR